MNLKGKKVLVAGAGISGVAAVKALDKLSADIVLTDSKSEEELKAEMDLLKDYDIEYALGNSQVDLENIDFILKSPGIPPTIDLFKRAEEKNIEIITDIELAYRISDAEFICLTGTNGKTTSTVLAGELFESYRDKVYVVGNVGVGILSKIDELLDSESVFIIEASSFQLDNSTEFRPHISLITNITPDHLDWHGNYENYINAKFKIFKNQSEGDFTVLNYDDKSLRDIDTENLKAEIIYFSSSEKLDSLNSGIAGVYLEDNKIVSTINGKHDVINIEDIKLPGVHNLENIMGVVAIAEAYGIDSETIKNTIENFGGVEHRLEFVSEIDGVKYYNDSKGTNVDSTVTAIRGLEGPINLIAGGKDKGGEFDELIDSFDGKIANLILLGETADKIEKTAKEKNFDNIVRVKNMAEAVREAKNLSEKGYTVLLSPACASWDMYKSYEIRGKDFKDNVKSLKGE